MKAKSTLSYEHYKAYQLRYKKAHNAEHAVFAITLSRSKDSDIIEYRKKFPRTWNSHIKQLIRKDMAK
jgi:hypothetical protein